LGVPGETGWATRRHTEKNRQKHLGKIRKKTGEPSEKLSGASGELAKKIGLKRRRKNALNRNLGARMSLRKKLLDTRGQIWYDVWGLGKMGIIT
jgi:hypothetical protein